VLDRQGSAGVVARRDELEVPLAVNQYLAVHAGGHADAVGIAAAGVELTGVFPASAVGEGEVVLPAEGLGAGGSRGEEEAEGEGAKALWRIMRR
jgi:hypothetical protein